MPQVVRAFPVLPGMEDRVRDLARALAGPRAEQAAAFYAKFGVSHESWHLQETPHGTWVIAVSAIDEPQTRAAEYAGARSILVNAEETPGAETARIERHRAACKDHAVFGAVRQSDHLLRPGEDHVVIARNGATAQ